MAVQNPILGEVIIRVDDKPTPGTIASYNGSARPGEIIVDPTVVPPALYIGDRFGVIRSDWTGGAGGGGNITPNSNIVVNQITANVINNLVSLSSNTANITNLTGNTANITNITSSNLTSNTANITNLTGNTANITNITSSNLTSNTANITNLTGNTANITNLTSSNLTSNTANITNLTSSNLTSNTGNITNLTSNTANITNLTSNTANITNLTTSNITSNTVTANTGNITTINSTTVNSNTGNITNLTSSNITSNSVVSNTITSNTITTSGDANIGGNINTTGSVTANNGFISNTLTTRTGPLTLTATGANDITLATGTGNINLSTQTYITNVKDPQSAQDAATKSYVDALAQGLRPKTPVDAATTGPLTGTYNNGAAGLGAFITLGTPITTLDTVPLVAGTSRILVKNQAAALENGIYVYTNSTTLTRATDADTPGEYPSGTFLYVEGGATFGQTGWALSSDTPTAIGTDPIVFSQIASAVGYTAGTGLSLLGTQFSIANTAVTPGSYGNATHIGTFTVNQQGQLTAANAIAIPTPSLIANGTSNVSIPTANGNVLVTIGGNANITAFTNNGITTNRIDTIGTITSLTDIQAQFGTGRFGALEVTGVSNLNAVSNVRISGGTSGQFLQTNGAGNLTWATVPTSSIIANGTSNVSIPTADGNVNTSVGGVANVLVVTTTGANVDGTLTANTGNITTVNTGLLQNGTSNIVINPSGNIELRHGGGGFSGLILTPTEVLMNTANVGTLSVGFTLNLPAVNNWSIPGGGAGQVLTSNGANGVSWQAPSGGLPLANGTSNINIPTADGNINTSVGGVANVLQVTSTGARITTTTATTNFSTGALVVSGGAAINGNLWSSGTVVGDNYVEGTRITTITGGIFAPDPALGSVIRATVAGNFTFGGFTNLLAGQSVVITLIQDAIGGRTMTVTDPAIKFVGGLKTLSTAPFAIDVLSVYNDGVNYLCSLTIGYA